MEVDRDVTVLERAHITFQSINKIQQQYSFRCTRSNCFPLPSSTHFHIVILHLSPSILVMNKKKNIQSGIRWFLLAAIVITGILYLMRDTSVLEDKDGKPYIEKIGKTTEISL